MLQCARPTRTVSTVPICASARVAAAVNLFVCQCPSLCLCVVVVVVVVAVVVVSD